MMLEVGQVWKHNSSNSATTYTILQLEDGKVTYSFHINYLEASHNNCCDIRTFIEVVNEDNRYMVLTDLAKALI